MDSLGLKTMTAMTPENSSQRNTSAAPDVDDVLVNLSQYLITMSIAVSSLVFVLGVLGNGVVIWVTGFRMKKTTNTVWYLHLAVADFIFAALLSLSVISLALDFHWPFGKFMCKLNTTIIFLNLFVSVYILVVISVDRCVSVVWPVWAQNHRNVRNAFYSCLNPLLYVFLRQDFKDEIRKSILDVLESAFQEEETRCPSDMKSVNTRQSREKCEGHGWEPTMNSAQAAQSEREEEKKTNQKTHVASLGRPGRHRDH
ncbi:hormone-sensitive lipase [Sarotherodon galilaeus]